MKLIEDFDTFEPKASKIISSGLNPICDHAGFKEGHFCCISCSNPCFDMDDLIEEGSLYYSFRRPIALDIFSFEKIFSDYFPKIGFRCKSCEFEIGFIVTRPSSTDRIYCVFIKNVYFDKKINDSPDLKHPL